MTDDNKKQISEFAKHIRRKIEDKIRKEFNEEKIFGLANLLDIDIEEQQKKFNIKNHND